jgi:hypothetical protein
MPGLGNDILNLTSNTPDKEAGRVGIEPTNGGTKTRCLTAWLPPKKSHKHKIWPLSYQKQLINSSNTFIAPNIP